MRKQFSSKQRVEHRFVDINGMECCESAVMERIELLQLLAHVEQQISDDMELIARQRRMLAALDGKSVDNTSLQIMLGSLENLLVFHLQEREKLRAELAKLEGPNEGSLT